MRILFLGVTLLSYLIAWGAGFMVGHSVGRHHEAADHTYYILRLTGGR